MPDSATSVRVLIVIETIGIGGGAEQLVATLVPHFVAQGVSITVAALRDWPESFESELVAAGARVHRLSLESFWRVDQGLTELLAISRSAKINLVWGHLYFGNLYAALLSCFSPRIQVVTTLHGSPAVPRGHWWNPKAAVFSVLHRFVLARSHVAVAVSEATAEEYVQRFGRFRSTVIPNCVDVRALEGMVSASDRARVRGQLGIADEYFLVVVPARYVPAKGHCILLRALAELRSVEIYRPLGINVVCFGEGPLLRDLQEMVEKLELAEIVRLHGPRRHSELIPLLAAADLVVLPSEQEAFGIVAVEAMAVNAPLLVSSAGGLPAVVGDAAEVFPTGESKALTLALARALAAKGTRNARSGRGNARARAEFDVKIIIQSWITLFERALLIRPRVGVADGASEDT